MESNLVKIVFSIKDAFNKFLIVIVHLEYSVLLSLNLKNQFL